jgi:hypothetical protein
MRAQSPPALVSKLSMTTSGTPALAFFAPEPAHQQLRPLCRLVHQLLLTGSTISTACAQM